MRLKLRTKILSIFILSIILSVVIFLFVIAYLINNGLWAGIGAPEMTAVVESATKEIQEISLFSEEDIKPILEGWKIKYPGMELELVTNQLKLIYTTASKQQIGTMNEMMESISDNEQLTKKRWVVAREINIVNGEKGYLVIIVPAEYFTAFSFNINGHKGEGVFGKMFIIGIAITLIISSAFAYMFSKSISKRFTELFKGISSFELGNLEIQIEDQSQDELGHLTVTFNRMATRLKHQIDIEKLYNDERKKLVSNISHDLRTPLTSIIGYSESLEKQVYEDEQERQKYIQIIRKKAIYMEKLLGELLEFSRLESGIVKLNKQKMDVVELVREVFIEYLPALEDNEIELKLELPENPLIVCVDKEGISRVLRNLIDNAVKYGSSGHGIDFSLKDIQDNFIFELKDEGLGIDHKNLEMIFQRFYREDRSRNSKEGGLGLGLAIADEIVKMHHGKIFVKSEVGKGSTFTVVLPK